MREHEVKKINENKHRQTSQQRERQRAYIEENSPNKLEIAHKINIERKMDTIEATSLRHRRVADKEKSNSDRLNGLIDKRIQDHKDAVERKHREKMQFIQDSNHHNQQIIKNQIKEKESKKIEVKTNKDKDLEEVTKDTQE